MSGDPADERFRGLDFDHSPETLRMFGLHEFRCNQLEAINATISGEDVFVVGDNGAGKSLCYQLPACFSAGVTVVISPTISLIQDQIQKLTKLGIEARTLSGDIGNRNRKEIYQQLAEDVPIIKLLYITPEMSMKDRLNEALQSLLRRRLLARFVIDEAQCIIESDSECFRPAFRTLNMLKKNFQGVPMIALSGPVRVATQEDILRNLQITTPPMFMYFNQTNLKYAVPTRTTEHGRLECSTWIKEHYPQDSGIVYCRKSEDCVSMAKSLNEAGLKAFSYNGRIPDRDRNVVQISWDNNDCKVICATAESFGFGIDKPDVRYVIHTFQPKSMENYYRESGRAGRDGNLSHCILFNDECLLLDVILKIESGVNLPENRELVNMTPMVEYCQNTVDCRRQQLLTYLDREANVCLPNSEAICDNCERRNAGAAATGGNPGFSTIPTPRTNQQPSLKPDE